MGFQAYFGLGSPALPCPESIIYPVDRMAEKAARTLRAMLNDRNRSQSNFQPSTCNQMRRK